MKRLYRNDVEVDIIVDNSKYQITLDGMVYPNVFTKEVALNYILKNGDEDIDTWIADILQQRPTVPTTPATPAEPTTDTEEEVVYSFGDGPCPRHLLPNQWEYLKENTPGKSYDERKVMF